LIETTVTGGKMNRGLTVAHSLQALLGRKLEAEERERAIALGWCVEWLQAFFLVADDVMDQSLTRRGQPCWYRQLNPLTSEASPIGNEAINDSFLLQEHVYIIIRHYCHTQSFYVAMMDLFHEMTYFTCIGQLLDMTSQPSKKVDLSLFTLALYKEIVKHKTAFYSFYLPVAIALVLAGVASEANKQISRDILLPMGEYFQIQDDFLDCYGAPEVIGKIGRDIEDNKCGWMIVQALQLCTVDQRNVLEQHYGKEDAEDVALVKKIYGDLNLRKVFEDYENDSYAGLTRAIDQVTSLPTRVFTDLLAKIYKRKL